ncbi:MAG: Ribosomal protein L4 [Methanophagales archaeon]|nr:50S ribosomal protein L4 [Methanophagales archaeon]MCU4140475.1 Ribosomal protein L4 [Methanophagales archaeon]
MKAKVLDISGNVLREVELPAVFSEEFRPDLIKKAVLSLQSRRFQPKGASKLAGKDTSAESWGPGHGVSRVPRIKTGRRAARVPQAVGGRRAHPPKAEKEILKKINKKERWKALRSAIAATADPSLVRARGHKFSEDVSLPIVVENALVTLSKTADVEAFLKAVGIWEDVLRAKRKKVRAGRGKMRGRRYRRKKSVLFVISGDEMPAAEGKEEKEERKEEEEKRVGVSGVSEAETATFRAECEELAGCGCLPCRRFKCGTARTWNASGQTDRLDRRRNFKTRISTICVCYGVCGGEGFFRGTSGRNES